jgi:V8-like Glu-specific endopeptidase
MRNFIVICLFCLIPVSVMSQKVTVQVLKVDDTALTAWQILDEEYRTLFTGSDFSGKDSVTFTLEANKRYHLHISVYEIYNTDTSLYSLLINGEPIILVKPGIGSGDHFFPFFTGIRDDEVKITGGTNAVISDFPWQVYYIAGDYHCGGSIIGENWIITAAHCTKNTFGSPIPVSEMSVKAGATNPYNVLEGQIYEVSEVIVNEGFDRQTLDNDIALLKLKQPVNYTNAAAPIKIITADDVAYGATDPGVISWVTGWGLTRINPDISPSVLQKVQLPIVSNTQASEVWPKIPASDLMAGYLNGNKDACSGDSGGPLAVPLFGEYKLAGIVSWGSANCNTYGAYTRVSDFEDWIREKTGIVKDYKPPAPEGETLICQGTESGVYSVEKLPQATNYEWRILPDEAGVVSGNSENASVLWNAGFTGSVTLILRVTTDNKVSDWSRLDINVVKNTRLLSQSGDTVLCAGKPVNLKVGAEGYNLTYNWYKNNQFVNSGSAGQLEIPATSTDNSGDYFCEINGSCGIISSAIINLTVHPVTAISFISPDVKVPFGDDVTLEVNAEGHELMYQWQKDNLVIDNQNSSQLSLNNLNAAGIGLYMATVTGTCGTVISDPVYLYVKKQNYSGEPEVFLWPSITSNEFKVALSTDVSYSISIINTMGQVIREYKNCRYQTTVNVSTMTIGVYIVNVIINNFRKSLRFIKE